MPLAYHNLIEWIVAVTGFSDSTLHVHVGLLFFFGTWLVTRRPLTSFLPLIAVLCAEIGNEVLDRAYIGSWVWPDTGWDAFHTLAWPVILTLAAVIADWRRKPA